MLVWGNRYLYAISTSVIIIIRYHVQNIKKYINLLRALKIAVKKALGYYDLFNS